MFRKKVVLVVSFAITSVLLRAIAINADPACLLLKSSLSDESASPRILGSLSYFLQASESVRFLVIEGVVKNFLGVTAKVNVTAGFYDANDNLVDVRTVGTQLELIKPGQMGPFTLYWVTNSSDVTYKLSVSYESTSEQPVDVLEFRNLMNQTEDSQFTVRGDIWNGRALKAISVSVACVCFNGKGEFSGLAGAYVNSINPGALAEFEVNVDPSVDLESYDLLVYAGGYEERSIANYVLLAVLVLVFLLFIMFMKRRGW